MHTRSFLTHTELGDLQGVAHRGVAQFRRVPYAVAPVGERRFLPPQPVEPWRGVFDATTHGPIAPQPPSRLRVAVGDLSRPQSEDCLTLTIATPAPDDKKRPVIVWLHGGGYSSRAGSLDCYDGATLARDGGVVVVGVNYRLGPLGYLYYDGLGDGQMGLRDMVEAIRWTAVHAGAFGGDPTRITVMGQSAGAHSILLMLTMPPVRSLFRRAILASAPGIAPYSRKEASAWTQQYRSCSASTTFPTRASSPACSPSNPAGCWMPVVRSLGAPPSWAGWNRRSSPWSMISPIRRPSSTPPRTAPPRAASPS
jgi:para-nitrobenzyl esterase